MSDSKPDLAAGLPSEHLRDGHPVTGTFQDQDVMLVRHAGGVSALSGKCTHLGAPLSNGLVAEGEIRCPWHHARFSLSDGTAVGGPAIRSLSCYEVEEADGVIRVLSKAKRPASAAAAQDERIVIVGTGAAGHALASHLGRAGRGADVTLIGAESEPPYDRTFCSKQYLQGSKSRDESILPAEGLEDVVLRTNTKVARIDIQGRAVETESGERIGYDKLVLATGAVPKRPNFPGAERGHVLRSLADADALITAADKAHSAVILGASFIGLEVAASLRARDLDVTIIAQGDVPLAGILGEEAGRFIMSLHENMGVHFRMGETVTAFDDGSVTTDTGDRLPADLLVLGVGVAPRTRLAEEAGLAMAEGGVAVDAFLKTSDPAIWAIGDIAAVPDPAKTGKRRRIEHWVYAQRMGEHLAQSFLTASAAPFHAAPFFWTGFYGKQFRYVGHAKPDHVRVEGNLQAGDAAIRYTDDSGSALLTLGRDGLAMEDERERERNIRA